MATVIPMRPYSAALHQAERAGHPEWRQHCIQAVARELRSGRNGHAVAGQLFNDRCQRPAPQDGAA